MSSLAYDYYWQYGRAHACEFVTAMILVFNVTSVFAYASSDDVLPLVPGLVAGFSIFALLQMFHYVSVAHVSPTVTFGFAITGNFDWRLVPSYVLCQLLGALTGAALVKVCQLELFRSHKIKSGMLTLIISFLVFRWTR